MSSAEKNGENVELKMGRGLKVFVCILLALALIVAAANIIPPQKVLEDNPFLKEEGALPMIAAHRGGGLSNPENTLMAYRAAVNEYDIQICETDLWMTSDGHLVYSHDASINRMACPEGAEPVLITEHTLEELRAYNMGYNFVDPFSGEYPYRDLSEEEQLELGLKILEFHELLEEFYDTNKDLLFIVEIKNEGERGFEAANIIDKPLTERRFVITQMLGVNLFFPTDFACLQIPMSYTLKGVHLDLTRQSYIDRAHRKNIAVQYWTINDEDDMRFLIEHGADAIMTDDPQLLHRVLEDYRS